MMLAIAGAQTVARAYMSVRRSLPKVTAHSLSSWLAPEDVSAGGGVLHRVCPHLSVQACIMLTCSLHWMQQDCQKWGLCLIMP